MLVRSCTALWVSSTHQLRCRWTAHCPCRCIWRPSSCATRACSGRSGKQVGALQPLSAEPGLSRPELVLQGLPLSGCVEQAHASFTRLTPSSCARRTPGCSRPMRCCLRAKGMSGSSYARRQACCCNARHPLQVPELRWERAGHRQGTGGCSPEGSLRRVRGTDRALPAAGTRLRQLLLRLSLGQPGLPGRGTGGAAGC